MVLVFSGDYNKRNVALRNNNAAIFHLFIMQVSEGESLAIPRNYAGADVVRPLFPEFLHTITESDPLIFGWIAVNVL